MHKKVTQSCFCHKDPHQLGFIEQKLNNCLLYHKIPLLSSPNNGHNKIPLTFLVIIYSDKGISGIY